MTREEFRQVVFGRSAARCVASGCDQPAIDAHHIVERRLFPDGGYDPDNGAALCGADHMLAEQTLLSCEDLRSAIGASRVVLPPHLYPDERYDKWGNIILPSGRRLKGELFDDESVQKVLAPVLHLFDNRVKYPRTWHLPWSESLTADDRMLPSDALTEWCGREVVVTEKMDGENTTLYRDYLHARSVEYSPHPSRGRIRQLHASICADIPEGMRICGENLSAKHSIWYGDLPALFLVFSVWEGTRCLSWDATREWAELLGLVTVPVLWRGWFDDLPAIHVDPEVSEGYVIRPAAEFTLRDFPRVVGKYVRKNHVQTHGHWMRSRFVPNEMR